MSGEQAAETFEQEVRRGLQHLYDPDELRKSPLLALLKVSDHSNPLASLRRMLTDAIQALKPGEGVPAHAQAWRIYQVLTYRYVEQLGQKEVAADLALSVRQLRRQEHEAVRVLANHLWTHHDLDKETLAPQPIVGPSSPAEPAMPGREQELDWLKKTFPVQAADVATMTEAVLRTLEPLIGASEIRVEHQPHEGLPPVMGQPSVLRQALLNLLSAFVRTVPGGTVQINAWNDQKKVYQSVLASGGRAIPAALRRESLETIAVSRQLVELSGGTLETPEPQQPYVVVATLVLPAVEQVPVLVIDDNTDTLQLFRRYLAASRYHFVGTPDPGQVMRLAQETAPRIIILDVMLPETDGWELLGRLRAHPQTREVPVVVCTILPQRQLALTLGAAAFLPKPVSRKTLLAVLDQQMTRPEPN